MLTEIPATIASSVVQVLESSESEDTVYKTDETENQTEGHAKEPIQKHPKWLFWMPKLGPKCDCSDYFSTVGFEDSNARRFNMAEFGA